MGVEHFARRYARRRAPRTHGPVRPSELPALSTQLRTPTNKSCLMLLCAHWGSSYKKPRTWQHIPRRVKRQTVSAQLLHKVCLPVTIQKYAPKVNWMIIWKHATDTARHARKTLAQQIQRYRATSRFHSLVHAAIHTHDCALSAIDEHPQHTPNSPPHRAAPVPSPVGEAQIE